MRRGIVLVLLVLLAACQGDSDNPTPELIAVDAAPTEYVRPSLTPTITPSVTPTPSTTPMLMLTAWSTPTPTLVPTNTDEPLVSAMIVVKPIPQGYPIPPSAVMRVEWPASTVPYNAYAAANDVVNTVTLVDLACYEVLVPGMVAPRETGIGYWLLESECERPPRQFDGGPLVDVVVAVHQIDAGIVISPGAVQIHRAPGRYVPPGALMSLSDVVGQTARMPILPQQVILNDRLRP